MDKAPIEFTGMFAEAPEEMAGGWSQLTSERAPVSTTLPTRTIPKQRKGNCFASNPRLVCLGRNWILSNSR